MRRTSAADLIAPLVVVGLAVYALLRVAYGSLPPLQYLLAVPIAGLAVVELVLARRVRAAVSHRPGAKPIAATAIARCAALAKASSLVAAMLLGAAVGALAYVIPQAGQIAAAAGDTRVAIAVGVVSVLLLAVSLYLERCTLDPSRPDRPDE